MATKMDGRSIQERLKNLKHTLKRFEHALEAKHGRVGAREAIKQDAAFQSKYREYKALQREVSMPATANDEQLVPLGAGEERTVLKERDANTINATPQKHSRRADKLAVPSPISLEVEATPACIRQALGPTPQRDGAILGIFDMMPSDTPSKGQVANSPALPDKVDATPSKPTTSSSANPLSRTPQSSGKRFFLTAYAPTPSKRKAEDELCTPSTSKRQFATPSFLRRNVSLPPIHEEGNEDNFVSKPFGKRKGLVRSLSTIIQGLKKQEEERMDDDWDIMNEIEAEEEDGRSATTKPKPKTHASDILAEDSQPAEMPLGPDQGVESSEDDGANDRGALDADGNPRKVWKKKGLKRQTKRTKMKPVVHKPGKALELEEVSGADENGDGEERHDSQLSTHEGGGKKAAKAKDDDEEPEKAKKTKKKSGPQDHANFRRLNIKNKNSKAKGRGGGRFGRR